MELFVVIEWFDQYEASGVLGVFETREEAESVAMGSPSLCSVIQRVLGRVDAGSADFTDFVEVPDPEPCGPYCPL